MSHLSTPAAESHIQEKQYCMFFIFYFRTFGKRPRAVFPERSKGRCCVSVKYCHSVLFHPGWIMSCFTNIKVVSLSFYVLPEVCRDSGLVTIGCCLCFLHIMLDGDCNLPLRENHRVIYPLQFQQQLKSYKEWMKTHLPCFYVLSWSAHCYIHTYDGVIFIIHVCNLSV